jgi:ATP-dependent protease ClpP protease subunit
MAGAFALLLALGLAASRPEVRGTEDAEIGQCREWIRSHSQRPPSHTALTRILSPRTLCFDGDIFSWTLNDANAWAGTAAKDRTQHPRLVVRSLGGDAHAAIDLAEKLQRLDAEVTVVDYCVSSCANYFFAALRSRRVAPGALILFHGGLSAEDRSDVARSLDETLRDPALAHSISDPVKWRADQLKQFDDDLDRQSALYRRAGVDALVVTGMSSVDENAIPASDCGPRKGARRAVLFFSLNQLRRLGIVIEEGRPSTDPDEADRSLARFGFTFTACAAPATYFNGRKDSR